VLQSEYRRPLGSMDADWYINGLFNWNGEAEIPGDIEGRLTSDSYYLLDLYADLDTESWSAKVWVKNAFPRMGCRRRNQQGKGERVPRTVARV
jgi:hypothetical protein